MKEVVAKFKKLNSQKRMRIAVLGDTLIDDYRYGNVSRISPEFPVPILNSESTESQKYPGGAGNVCYQMVHMNADVFLLGFLDKTAWDLYDEYKFNTDYCVGLHDSKGIVPIKVRFYNEEFPLLRWDIEQPNYGVYDLTPLRTKAIHNFKELAKGGLDAAILSDYNKGFWSQETAQEVVKICQKYNIKTVVDPKKPPLQQWKGCDVIKPNAAEAKTLTMESEVDYQLYALCNKHYGAKSAIITQSEKGVKGLTDSELFEYKSPFKLRSKEVNSVIGAGDCFIAIFTLGLSHGLSPQESVGLAFEAGAVYVKARHNQPITIGEVMRRVDPIGGKIVTPEELVYVKNNIQNDEKFVFTNGCFDILHPGHVDMLENAKRHGDKLIVGVNTDASVKRLKGESRPINDIKYRMTMLAAQQAVDYVVSFDEDTPLELLEKVKPDLVVKGGDYKPEEVVCGGYKVLVVPFKDGFSTTGFLEKIGGRIHSV